MYKKNKRNEHNCIKKMKKTIGIIGAGNIGKTVAAPQVKRLVCKNQ